jgi:hypothetical protein
MNYAASSPASIQFSQLARDLNRMGPAQRRRLKVAFAGIGQAALSDARSRAGAWSSRIPAAITTRAITDTTRGRVGVELRVSAKAAPHARPFEGLGNGGTFRHPVFGRDRWVSQKTRPFMAPATEGHAADARRAVEDTFEAAARECGFR